MYKWLITALLLIFSLQAYAYEDYIITTKGKLTNILIEDNTVINVYPITTVMNKKNTLMVTPLKEGKTSFSVLKNNKETVSFEVIVEKNKTTIADVKTFDILALDRPYEELLLDEPPMLKEVN